MNKFIVFEGIDACGKSTQIRSVKKILENKGEKVWSTEEPYPDKIGELIRY